MTPALGDVVARARGLAMHLLSEAVLEQLADAAGSAALAGLLAQHGYPAAPAPAGASASGVETVQAAIERESARRLALLAHWLGDRRALFACVFEDEERRVLRSLLRRAATGSASASAAPRTDALVSLAPRTREALARAGDTALLVRVLQRSGSPYAAPLARVLRERGPDLVALEGALDRSFAERARGAARRGGPALVDWVADDIDLENAWSVLLGAGAEFLAGGRRLSRAQRDAIQREPREAERRARLAALFTGDALAETLGDAEAPIAVLERRTRRVRTAACTRAARIDPLGPLALLAVLLRLREEAAALRRIAGAVAQATSGAHAGIAS